MCDVKPHHHQNEQQYVNRYGYHSINVLCVCGPDRKFCYVSARWPGAVNDARVLRNSTLFEPWETAGWRPFQNAIILGDSAYPLNECLVPPLSNPDGPTEERFTKVVEEKLKTLLVF